MVEPVQDAILTLGAGLLTLSSPLLHHTFSPQVNISVIPTRDGPAPKPGACATPCVVVRGFEQPATAPALTLASGFTLPSSARLELQVTDLVAAPNTFVPLLTVPAGREAIVWGLGMGLETSPPWGSQDPQTGKRINANNYVEGCWSLLRTHNESLPGQVLGTGLEDFWDSAFGFSLIDPGASPQPRSTDTDGEIRQCLQVDGRDTFCPVTGAPFQHSTAGVLHFSSDYTDPSQRAGVERFSAYRYFDAEVVGVDDGGVLGWTNGCASWNKPGTNKCGVAAPLSERELKLGACQTSFTRVQGHVWVYTWPKSSGHEE